MAVRFARRLRGQDLYLLLSAIPLFVLVISIAAFAVDVPIADQWALVPLLEQSYAGRLSLRDLWAQHNEHRLLFPRLLMIGLARLTGWNTTYELGANVVFAAGIAWLLGWQACVSAKMLSVGARPLLPVIALAVFSLNQAENWLAGWNMQIFLAVLGVVAAVVLLARTGEWPPFALAVLAGVVASYAALNGNLVWPIGLVVLLAGSRAGAAPGRLRVALWLAAGALTLATYVVGYRPTAEQPALAAVLASGGRYAQYALIYLGAPLARGPVELAFELVSGDAGAICNLGDSALCATAGRAALLAGAAGVVLAVVAGVVAARDRALFAAALPFLALMLYGLSCAVLTSAGRTGFGVAQALSQRYATVVTPFWMSIVVVLYLAARAPHPDGRFAAPVYAAIAVFVALVVMGTLQGRVHLARQHAFLAEAREALVRLDDDALIGQRVFPDPAFVRANVHTLQEHHLSVFRTQ
jgi:hypothetical protein